MKLLVSIIAFLLFFNSNAQQERTVVKEVTREISFQLNNGINSTILGGISRKYIEIDLPPNTSYWYYTFTTSLDSNNSAYFDNVTHKIIKAAAAYATNGASLPFNKVFDGIPMPTGKASVNVYVLDKKNVDLFLNKKQFQYFNEGTALKKTQSQEISQELYGRHFYLGIQNTSSMQRGVFVSIKVYANTIEKVYSQTNSAYSSPSNRHYDNPNTESSQPSNNSPFSSFSINRKANMFASKGYSFYREGSFDSCIIYSKKH